MIVACGFDLGVALQIYFQRLVSSVVAVRAGDKYFPEHGPNVRWLTYVSAKRFLDVVLGVLALIVLFPILLIIAVAIKIESPGPVLFLQTRWGRDLEKFKVLKFRTMYHEVCDASGVTQTTEDDTRTTPFGRFLRRTNLDEIPQLVNILRGEMSIVGPRCHPVGMLAAGVAYEDLVPAYHLRHTVKPGLTGLAQAHGLRGPTDNAELALERVRADLHYIDEMSLWLDLQIIGRTFVQEMRACSGS